MFVRCCLLTLLVVFETTALHAQDISTMLQRVPANANIVSVFDVTGLMQSDLGSQEGWAQKRNMDYEAGVVPFPPTMKLVVTACDFHLAERNCAWQIALTNFSSPVDPYVVAKKEGSDVEWIDNLFVIPSRRNAYFLQLDRQNYGTYTPANRQQFTRWVQSVKEAKDSKISPYLINTVQQGGAFGQITIAMDLANFMTKPEVLKRLQQSKAVEDNKAEAEAWAGFIAGIKGLRLSIKADSAFKAELKFDFSESAKPYEALFATLLNEVVTQTGVPLGDMTSWKIQAMGNSMTLRGNLHTDEVRRIAALVMPLGPNSDVDSGSLSGSQAVVVTSQRFYRALNSLTRELRAKSDMLDKQRDWNNNALWYEYTARKIDQLPDVNADPDLVKLSGDIANKLRIMAQSLRGVNIQNKVLDSQQYTNQGWGGGYAGWGGGYGRYSESNWREVASAKVEQAAKGATDRNAIWVTINDGLTSIQQALAKKYNVDF